MYKKVLIKVETKLNNVLRATRPFVLPFFIVFAIYLVAMFSILRAGVSYIDDMGRAVSGYAWVHDFNRYSASYLAYILNFNFKLTDISPIPQIVAMMFLSVCSVIVTYLFCERKIKYLPLVLSTFIGLIPFTIECWLYKFDSAGMALGILASILPFCFYPPLSKSESRKSWLIFGIISFICLMIMWTSYQASSGIYIIMILAIRIE